MKCSLGAVQRCQLLILLLTITMGGMIMMAQATKETDAVSEEESLLFDFPRAKQPPKMMEESWFPLHVLKKMTSHLKNTKERGAKRTSTEMEYFRAIARKDVGTVRTLLAKEPLLVQTVHYEENIGEASSFQLCAYVNSADICALVAETKNGPTYVDAAFSPFVIAATLQHYDVLARLLADVPMPDLFYKRFIKALAHFDDGAATEVLLDTFPRTHWKNGAIREALHIASSKPNTEVFEKLLEEVNELGEGNLQELDVSLPMESASINNSIGLYLWLDFPFNATNSNGETILHIAARNCHLHNIRALVDIGVRIDVTSIEGFTPLYLASQCENPDTFREITIAENLHIVKRDLSHLLFLAIEQRNQLAISRLASLPGMVFNKTKDQETLLHLAASRADIAVLINLLNAGALVDQPNEYGACALHKAVQRRSSSHVNVLLSRRANTRCQDHFGNSPLHTAADMKFPAIVPVLCDFLADPNLKRNDGKTPLHVAVEKDDCNMIFALAKCDANMDARRPDSFAPLHDAAMRGAVGTAKCLLQSGANVDSVVHWNASSAHLLAIYGHELVFDVLCEYGANIVSSDDNGYTPLHVAVEHDRLKLVRRMLNHSIPAGVAGSKGLTPVHVAAEKNRLEILKLLKSNGADLTVKSLWGTSPLHLASINGNVQVIHFLVSSGVDIESFDNKGVTSLMAAVENSQIDACTELLQLGARIDSEDYSQRTTSHVAVEHGNKEILHTLVNFGAKLDACDISSVSYWKRYFDIFLYLSGMKEPCIPLVHAAIASHQPEMLNLLLQKGASANSSDIFGVTALHIAIEYDDLKAMCTLLLAGANVDTQADGMIRPLHLAATKEDPRYLEELLRWGAQPVLECWYCIPVIDYASSNEMAKKILDWKSIAATSKLCSKSNEKEN